MNNPYEETAETLRDFLRREGYVRCDSPACACGSYHGRFGLHERWQKVKDALAEADHPLTNANGNTVLRALGELVADRDRLREALASVVKHWREFGPEHGFDETLERAALAGGAEPKHAPHCSSIPDASGPAQQCDCGAEPKYPHADEPVMWFDRDRETRAESPAKPQATLGTARHFCLACTRAFGCLPGECTAEPASEPRDDAEAMCRLLASIWFYGNWRWETPNERDLQAILERRGWWPITEDALIAKARAADQTDSPR